MSFVGDTRHVKKHIDNIYISTTNWVFETRLKCMSILNFWLKSLFKNITKGLLCEFLIDNLFLVFPCPSFEVIMIRRSGHSMGLWNPPQIQVFPTQLTIYVISLFAYYWHMISATKFSYFCIGWLVLRLLHMHLPHDDIILMAEVNIALIRINHSSIPQIVNITASISMK